MTAEDGPFPELEREFSLLLRRARTRQGELSREVHPELDGAAYALLQTVATAGGMRARDVATLFGVDKGAISRQVARLERTGLLTRRTDPEDARALLLVVTEEGRRRVERATASRRTRFRQRLAQWSPEDVAQLAALLGRLNRDLDVAPHDAADTGNG